MPENLLFNSLTRAVPGLVWLSDATANIEFINARWHEFTGLPEAEALGRGWFAVVHPSDAAAFQARVAVARPDVDYMQTEIRIRCHDGTYHRHILSARQVEDGTWVGCALDIEDWLAAERRDAMQEAILKGVISGIELAQLLDELAAPRNARSRAPPAVSCWSTPPPAPSPASAPPICPKPSARAFWACGSAMAWALAAPPLSSAAT